MIRPSRRDFLKLLLATAAAESIDYEKLLWVPKPIVTVTAKPVTIGAIDRATYAFWRNQFVGGMAGGGKSRYLNEIAVYDSGTIKGLDALVRGY